MKVIVENIATEYRDENAGPVMLLLHGWGNTLSQYDALCREIKGFRMIRLDLPGFGASESPNGIWNVEKYARFVESFCQKLGIKPALMVGHSFGGRIITKGVAEHIFHPEKIVLIASAGVADRRTLRNMLYAGIAKTGKFMLAPFSPKIYQRARELLYARTGSDYLTTGSMSETFLAMIREDLSADAAKIQLPALLIWGADDIVTPLPEGKKLHTLIAHSMLRVLPEAGHFVHCEKPAEVARMIKEFV